MIASALRFASEPTPENLTKADAWADAAIGAVLPRVYQGFGVIQLMVSEALRRVAWSTFYFDTVIDGGRYGFHTLDERALRLQLPCDEDRFLGNEATITEPLCPDPINVDEVGTNDQRIERAPLGISAYLIRAAAARRRALFLAFRVSHKEDTEEKLSGELIALEADVQRVITALPKRLHLTSDSFFLHREHLTTFILLHVLRHNLFIIIGRASLQIYQRDISKADLIPQVRQKRISHALPIASLLSEGLKAGIAFDPQLGVHAYVALEILLFEPRRLAETDSLVNSKSPEITEALPTLLTVIRNLAARSEFIKHLSSTLKLSTGCYDANARTSSMKRTLPLSEGNEYQILGQETAEFDFREFRWAKIERLRRGAKYSAHAGRDEDLLEYNVGAGTAAPSIAPSPRLDAIDVDKSLKQPSTAHSPAVGQLSLETLDMAVPQVMSVDGMSQADPKWTGPADMNGENGQAFSLDWAWLLGELEPQWDQGRDPTLFWS
ncbi:unnamed protein product [Clonostachys rosea]|uniref:Transcription factor domain-containing protein n=1 Tax=Bionectria ochroleuca TaxID=29856 RepID=A0ABY6TXP3_BIOOC|nr:unnamed protein product [Clonostachys rosea]